ncbi:MAG TPA: hypothetical protein VJR02_27455, partial [Pyrinomonadaceae bacterium]|nr:hypothetical protein [Pyrinomonadaceae bacterium]
MANTIKTTGGHGGPPLQYVSWRQLASTDRSLDLCGNVFSVLKKAIIVVLLATAAIAQAQTG